MGGKWWKMIKKIRSGGGRADRKRKKPVLPDKGDTGSIQAGCKHIRNIPPDRERLVNCKEICKREAGKPLP